MLLLIPLVSIGVVIYAAVIAHRLGGRAAREPGRSKLLYLLALMLWEPLVNTLLIGLIVAASGLPVAHPFLVTLPQMVLLVPVFGMAAVAPADRLRGIIYALLGFARWPLTVMVYASASGSGEGVLAGIWGSIGLLYLTTTLIHTWLNEDVVPEPLAQPQR
ncbi:hypothetical protein F8S13_01355 [Chloroflexia bacterium SDU3-3]|nr:hypothetical protein F8S13_01355 [Chloroflexia bacterium SDU3-3]